MLTHAFGEFFIFVSVTRKLTRIFVQEVGFVILDIIEQFISAHQRDLKSKPTHAEMLEQIFSALCVLLRRSLPLPFIPHLYASIRIFLEKFSNSFFGKSARGFGYCASTSFSFLFPFSN